MKTLLKRTDGFTLIEMLVVLMIISVLLLIALPNMTKNTDMAGEKSCDATRKLAQTQVAAYEIEHGQIPPNLDVLVEQGYIDQLSCAAGKRVVLIGKDVVVQSE